MLGLIIAINSGCGSRRHRPGVLPGAPPELPAVPAKVNVPLDPNLHRLALSELEKAFTSNDPILRANAVEVAQDANSPGASAIILRGLLDRDALVRFASAMAAGRVRLADARPILLRMRDEKDPNVAIGVRFALHKLGDARLTHDFEKFAINPDNRIRGNTAMALGLLGEPTGMILLKVMDTDRSPAVRWQVAEAMWRLGDEGALKTLVAGSVSQFADDQLICVLALAGPRDARVAEHLRGKLVYEPGSGWDEVALVATRGLGMLGYDDGYSIAIRGARSADPRQRQLAAMAFGAIKRTDAQSYLATLLKDEYQPVRLAAAGAVLQLKAS